MIPYSSSTSQEQDAFLVHFSISQYHGIWGLTENKSTTLGNNVAGEQKLHVLTNKYLIYEVYANNNNFHLHIF